MGKVMSRFSLFKGCREEDPEETKKEEKKQKEKEDKKSSSPKREAKHIQGLPEPPIDLSSSEIGLEEEKDSVSEISAFRNNDCYFSAQENEYYMKKYEKEKVEPKRASKINWKCGEVLGSGSFGRVLYGLNNETGQVMAVKQVLLSELKNTNMTERIKALELEIEILSHLNHKNIVRYLGTTRDNQYFNIFLEYEAGGSIAGLIKKYGEFDESLIRIYTKQILEGLEYLHAHNVIHRDIKGANVLVDSNGVVKLADFGGAKKIYNTNVADQYNSLKGTPYWMAPEVIKQTGHGRFADIWSLGCTIIEMATGHPPWSHYKNQFTALYYIGNATAPPPYPQKLSQTAKDFLNLIFKRNPKKRANVCKLLSHPFITNEDKKMDLSASSKIIKKEESINIIKNKSEEDISSLASPQNIKPAIEVDESIDDSEYITGEQKSKVAFTFVAKGNKTTQEKK